MYTMTQVDISRITLSISAQPEPIPAVVERLVQIAHAAAPRVALVMARLPRPTFALLLALLPATAATVGLVVLAQLPGPTELVGIGLVVAGVALHRARHTA